jgi:choline dehydrogenase-like flavoprotein
MTEPTELDRDLNGNTAKALLKSHELVQAVGHLNEVQQNIQTHTCIIPKYHIGDILKNEYYPEKIAVLRLDTDWYESTRFELDNFYDKVVPGGYVIIDDYGHWKGCKQAVDEFLATRPEITLTGIDYTGVFFRKP